MSYLKLTASIWLFVLTVWAGSSAFSKVTVRGTVNDYSTQPANKRYPNPSALVLGLCSVTALAGCLSCLAWSLNELNDEQWVASVKAAQAKQVQKQVQESVGNVPLVESVRPDVVQDATGRVIPFVRRASGSQRPTQASMSQLTTEEWSSLLDDVWDDEPFTNL